VKTQGSEIIRQVPFQSIFRKIVAMWFGKSEEAVFWGFSFVSAQLQGFSNLRLRQSLAKTPKSSLHMATVFLQTL
jgi:hypothetical protein